MTHIKLCRKRGPSQCIQTVMKERYPNGHFERAQSHFAPAVLCQGSYGCYGCYGCLHLTEAPSTTFFSGGSALREATGSPSAVIDAAGLSSAVVQLEGNTGDLKYDAKIERLATSTQDGADEPAEKSIRHD